MKQKIKSIIVNPKFKIGLLVFGLLLIALIIIVSFISKDTSTNDSDDKLNDFPISFVEQISYPDSYITSDQPQNTKETYFETEQSAVSYYPESYISESNPLDCDYESKKVKIAQFASQVGVVKYHSDNCNNFGITLTDNDYIPDLDKSKVSSMRAIYANSGLGYIYNWEETDKYYYLSLGIFKGNPHEGEFDGNLKAMLIRIDKSNLSNTVIYQHIVDGHKGLISKFDIVSDKFAVMRVLPCWGCDFGIPTIPFPAYILNIESGRVLYIGKSLGISLDTVIGTVSYQGYKAEYTSCTESVYPYPCENGKYISNYVPDGNISEVQLP